MVGCRAPDLTIRSPISGTGWEGVGVVTDVLDGKNQDVMVVARNMAKGSLGLDQDLELNPDL